MQKIKKSLFISFIFILFTFLTGCDSRSNSNISGNNIDNTNLNLIEKSISKISHNPREKSDSKYGISYLFDDIYYKIATRHGKVYRDDIKTHLKNNKDYKYKYHDIEKAYEVIDPYNDDGSYVFIMLNEGEEWAEAMFYFDAEYNLYTLVKNLNEKHTETNSSWLLIWGTDYSDGGYINNIEEQIEYFHFRREDILKDISSQANIF